MTKALDWDITSGSLQNRLRTLDLVSSSTWLPYARCSPVAGWQTCELTAVKEGLCFHFPHMQVLSEPARLAGAINRKAVFSCRDRRRGVCRLQPRSYQRVGMWTEGRAASVQVSDQVETLKRSLKSAWQDGKGSQLGLGSASGKSRHQGFKEQ